MSATPRYEWVASEGCPDGSYLAELRGLIEMRHIEVRHLEPMVEGDETGLVLVERLELLVGQVDRSHPGASAGFGECRRQVNDGQVREQLSVDGQCLGRGDVGDRDIEPGRQEAAAFRTPSSCCAAPSSPSQGAACPFRTRWRRSSTSRYAVRGTASANARAVTVFPTAGPPVSRSGGRNPVTPRTYGPSATAPNSAITPSRHRHTQRPHRGAVSTGHRNTSWSSLRGGMGWWADGADGVVAGGGR